MAINISDFIDLVKRTSRYGVPTTPGEQPTTDLLSSINLRGARIWGAANWKWQLEVLSFAVAQGTSQYTVKSKSGNAIDRILNIIPIDLSANPAVQGKPLQEMEIGDFYTKNDLRPGYNLGGMPESYCNIGQDANGNWLIIISPQPSSGFKMSGYAKAVLPVYVQADVTANNPFKYFPNSVVLDTLFNGVYSDAKKSLGEDTVAKAYHDMFELSVKHLISEQIGVARDNSPLTIPLPDFILRRHRGRRYKGLSAG